MRLRVFGFRPFTAYLPCAIVALALATAASAQTADLVFLNGKVFTADARSSLAEGFATSAPTPRSSISPAASWHRDLPTATCMA